MSVVTKTYTADSNSPSILTTDNEAYSAFQGKSGETIPAGYACHDSVFTETNAAYASVTENIYEECDAYINAEESKGVNFKFPLRS